MKPQSSRVLGAGSVTRRCDVVEELKGMASCWKRRWELRALMCWEDMFEEVGLDWNWKSDVMAKGAWCVLREWNLGQREAGN